MFLERTGRPSARQHALRSVALRAAVPRLSRQHRHLPRAHPDVPRQGRGVQSDRPAGRLFRLSPWVERAGRFRSLGDGQVDFGAVFSKLTAYDFDGWAVVEWECALKHPEDGAREGAEFVKAHIIRVTEKAFDDFAAGGTDEAANRRSSASARESHREQRDERQQARPHPPRHGRRRQGRLHRRGASHRGAHRRRVRAGRRRALVDAGKGAGLGPRPSASPPDRIYDDFATMAKREARRKNGIEAVAIVTPNHMHAPAAQRVPEARHPCHLRQAADRDAAPRRRSSRRRLPRPTRSSSSPTTTPAIRWSGRRAR